MTPVPIDTAVIQRRAPEELRARNSWGAIFYFDQANVAPVPPPDQNAWRARRVTFEMRQILTLKELPRGNRLDALAFYNGCTLRPLIAALRMHYDPARYARYNFPADVVQKLEEPNSAARRSR